MIPCAFLEKSTRYPLAARGYAQVSHSLALRQACLMLGGRTERRGMASGKGLLPFHRRTLRPVETPQDYQDAVARLTRLSRSAT